MITDTKEENTILAMGESPTLDIRYDGNICYIPFAYHLIPIEGIAKTAAVMRRGELAGRPDNGWREVPIKEHINHAISHLLAYVAGRHKEPHLANAACRVLMALDLDRKEVLPVAFPNLPTTLGEGTRVESPTLMGK
jgi:hypothetical protein